MAGEKKKRTPAMEASSSQPPAKKKRVELSQLPSPFDAVNTQISAIESNTKDTRSEKKELGVELEKAKEIDVSSVGVIIPHSSQEEPQVEHTGTVLKHTGRQMSAQYA